jgi:intraflagellar transport protein 81
MLQVTQRRVTIACHLLQVDLQRLSLQAAQLQQSIAALQDARAAREKARQGDRAYLQVRQAQQMAGVVQRKREELAAKLERLQVSS